MQCVIVATDLDGNGFGSGLHGKLQRLTQQDVDLSPNGLTAAISKTQAMLDRLLEGCVKTRQRVAAGGAP